MPRYIDEGLLKDEIDGWLDSVGNCVIGKGLSYYGELIGCIEDTPTADVKQAVRGEWNAGCCTVCGAPIPIHTFNNYFLRTTDSKYCYRCGANMNGSET